jgi:lysozyme family protein
VRIAGPILLATTPVGMIFGLREAWRLAGPKMAVLMAVMLAVVGALVWWTVQRIRAEHAAARAMDTGRRLSGD